MPTEEIARGRVGRTKAAARASYNRMSRWYDWLAGGSERRYREAGLRLLDVQQGESVLEIGYGTGLALSALAMAVGSTGRVWGLDISEGMASMAAKRLRRCGMAGRARLVQGDAAHLPFRAGALDAIYLSFTLELFDTPEIPVVLDECQRVLCPGGRLCVVAMSCAGPANLMTRLYAWAHTRFPSYVDCRPIQARRVIEAAGYRLVDQLLTSMWGLPIEIALARRPSAPGR